MPADLFSSCPHLTHLQADGEESPIRDVEILNLATGERSSGTPLPEPSAFGCATFDSDDGYVYYLDGMLLSGSGSEGVYRMKGKSSVSKRYALWR